MPKIASTTWAKISPSPAGLTPAKRLAYRTWYENTYNNGYLLDRTGIQIHHIRPREYGSTHAYSNLIPLTQPSHALFNTWFVQY